MHNENAGSQESVGTGSSVPNSMASEPLTREALYELVWSEPMIKVGARFNVSGSYMARICELLNVPRPERGYWAKLEVGTAPKKPELPEPRPGDEIVWSRDGNLPRAPRRIPRPPEALPARKRRRRDPPDPLNQQHSLLVGAKPLFEKGRLSYEVGYLKPYKKLLVDITATKTGIDKALAFANQLFLELESYGHRVVIAPESEQFRRNEVQVYEGTRRSHGRDDLWSPWRCTVVYIGTVAIGLTIFETAEEAEARYVNGKYVRVSEYVPPKRPRYYVDNSWTTKKDYPTGRLCLQAFSPYRRANWAQVWREAGGRDLASQIPSIIKALEGAVAEIARLVEEGERQAEIERKEWEAKEEQWRREAEAQRAAKARKDSKEELFRVIEKWGETTNLERFFMEAESRAASLPDGERRAALKRIQLARGFVGKLDPLEYVLSWRTPEERLGARAGEEEDDGDAGVELDGGWS